MEILVNALVSTIPCIIIYSFRIITYCFSATIAKFPIIAEFSCSLILQKKFKSIMQEVGKMGLALNIIMARISNIVNRIVCKWFL